MYRGRARSRSIYHIVEKDESSSDEGIKRVESSDKVTSLDGKFFEQFIALKIADEEESYTPIQDESVNNNATVDFTQCRGQYQDIPRPTQKEADFYYSSILGTVNQRLGVPSEMKELPNRRLFEYLQETLNVKPQEHVALMQQISQAVPSPLILVADVISAKGLVAKDANGFSDPFCILGIVPLWTEYETETGGKKSQARLKHDVLVDHHGKDSLYYTKVQEKTLNPSWNEQFRFDVGDFQKEQLQVEVWDHDEETSLVNQVKNIGEVANIKGMGRYLKEITKKKDGKNMNDFLGWVTIPLNTISSQGLECSFPLQSRSSKSKVDGELKLRLQLALKKETPKATVETMGAMHQYLWYSFIHHEVCDNGLRTHRWSGQLPPAPEAIVHQLAQQQQLPDIYRLASKWIAYSQPCVLPYLDLNVMLSIITAIANLWDQHAPDQQMATYIHKSCQEFVDHSIRLLQKQHEAFPYRDQQAVMQLHILLRCLSVIKQLSEKLAWGIFSTNIQELITDAVRQSARDWFIKQRLLCEGDYEARINAILQGDIEADDVVDGGGGDECDGGDAGESRHVQILVSLIENMIHHVRVQIRSPALVYHKTLEINLPLVVHSELATKVMEETEEMMAEPVKLSDSSAHRHSAIALFSLYLALKGFHAAADREYRDDLQTTTFYSTFKKVVEQWFELARKKAKARIHKAVEVDEIRLVDSMVKHSSSAVDVTTTLAQIKEFWTKLDWPDPSGAYVFVAKVTDDIRQGAVEYAAIIHRKLEVNHFYDNEGQFDITDQLCIAINNIEQVRRYLASLPGELDFERVLDGVLMEHGSVGVDQCRLTLDTMLSSADEDMLNVIGKVVRRVGYKMAPDLQKYTAPLMAAGVDTPLDDVITPLMEYLDSNLITLHSCLLKANFQRVLEELWLVVMNILKDMVNSGYKTLNQHPPIGQRMHDAFQVVGDFFHAEGKGLPTSVIQCPAFKEAMSKLSKFGTSTRRLLEDYLMARVMQQEAANKSNDSPLGVLTVKCNYKQSQQKLRVRVMNATQIKPMDKDGLSDPFVVVYLQPNHVFPGSNHKKTQVMKKTLHPLFDETFEFSLPAAQVHAYGATLHFVLMDRDFLSSEFGAEAYIQVSNVPGVHGKQSKNLAEEKAVPLHLLPGVTKADEAWHYVQTLKQRSSDKMAAEFLKLHRIK